MQGTWVASLVRELRSPCRASRPKEKEINWLSIFKKEELHGSSSQTLLCSQTLCRTCSNTGSWTPAPELWISRWGKGLGALPLCQFPGDNCAAGPRSTLGTAEHSTSVTGGMTKLEPGSYQTGQGAHRSPVVLKPSPHKTLVFYHWNQSTGFPLSFQNKLNLWH